jgi:hypothetical protein
MDYVIPANPPEVVPLPKAFDAAHEALHPDQIDYASFGNNAALQRASNALKFAYDEGNAINHLRANPHDEDRAATHDRKVRERVDGFDRTFAQNFDGARADIQSELRRTEADLEQKAGLKANPAWSTAIVGTIQHMSPSERNQAVADLIEQGDHATLATLMDAPLLVSKLTAEQRDSIKTRVFMKVDPKGLALRDQLANALIKLDAASIASLTMRERLRAGTGPGEWKDRAKSAAVHNAATNLRRG